MDKTREENKMKKRVFSAILTLCLLLTMMPTVAFAADDDEVSQSNSALVGNCGAEGSESSVTWKLTQNNAGSENPTYTLTISGSGAMADYTANINNGSAKQPWRASATGVEIEKITNVVVSEGVTSIGAFAFNGLTGVSEYDIGANVNTISQWALDTSAAKGFNVNGNANFKTDDDGVLFSDDGTTLIAYPGGSDVRDEYAVPSTVTAISDGAFVGCPIKKLTIGKNVTKELPGWSFNGGVLEELNVNCPFGKSTFARITTLNKVTLGDSITEIPQMAFLDCKGLQTVSIPSGLTNIGSQAFFGCSSLKDVTLPASLTEIGYQAFRDCDALTSIIFPDSLTKISESAFSGCTGLTYISYGNGINDIGGNAFGGCTGVKVIDLHCAIEIGEKYDNGDGKGDSALTHACIKDTKYVKYYLRTKSQAESVKGNLEWGKGGAGKGNITNTYYILTATDAVLDYTGQTETPKRAGYTFDKWEAVNNVSQGSTTTQNVYTDANSWSLASPTVTVSPASANTYVNGSAVTLTATVSEPVDGFTYSYQWYRNTSNSNAGGTTISEATRATYSPNITAAGTTYYYCVVKVAKDSNTTSATTKVIPVTVANTAGSVKISDKKTAATYGDKPFTFTYTASKAATVTSSNTSVATVQDKNGTVTVTIVGAGTTEISVGFDADTNYSAASDKFTLTVNKATPTITISATPNTLTGGGSVELKVAGVPTDDNLVVTCDNGITVKEKDGKYTYTAQLPNATQNYIFTAKYTGTDNYNDVEKSCKVSVTYKGSSHHSSSTSNTVSASTASNGKVSLDKSTAKKGDKVTVTVTPDAGYQLDKLTVTDAKGKTVDVTDKGNGKFTFTMPEGKVTVTPTFVADNGGQTESKSFSDVKTGDWYADAVKYVSDKGLMSGTGSDKFAPSATTTRAMLMTVLARYAGKDTAGSTPWYQAGMDWAKENGVSDGTKPTENITREQLVTMLYRSAGSPAASGSLDNFSDSASVGGYAVNAMKWAVANGIVNGSNGKLNPKNNATRAEVAAILMRFCEKTEK